MIPDTKTVLLKQMVRWALLWLLLAAAIGVGLRYTFVGPVPAFWNYRFLLHAHSHVMLLGWAFTLLMVGLLVAFVPAAKLSRYRVVFWVLQIAVAGMLVAFPIQGYALFSIAFSSLHMVASFVFCGLFVKDTRGFAFAKDTISIKWIYWAFAFLILSSLGPMALGILKAKGLSDTHWYSLSLYFYLHFQYNGWLLFGIIGLFLRWMEQNNLSLSYQKSHWMLRLMVPAGFLTYGLSALWTEPPTWVYLLSGLGVIAQLSSVAILIFSLKGKWAQLTQSPIVGFLWGMAGLAFVLKNILQAVSVSPILAQLAYEQRNIVIAYLHLVFIGIISFFMIGHLLQHKLLSAQSPWLVWGIRIFAIAFVAHELILVMQPFALWIHTIFYPALLGLSITLWGAVFLLFLSSWQRKS